MPKPIAERVRIFVNVEESCTVPNTIMMISAERIKSVRIAPLILLASDSADTAS